MHPSPVETAPVLNEALVEQARRGDAAALALLVETHIGDAFDLAARILGDRDLAFDATQEAIIRALKGLKRFRGDSSFRTWLLRITHNTARSLARRQFRRREIELSDLLEQVDNQPDPEERAMQRLESDQVRRALESLPTKQRLAVTLRVYQGLSYREVSEVVNCSEVAARVNYHLGVKKLKEKLAS